ncbi:hypothetical protein MMC20_005240 [Loxospora ochrophaea]|nr:hypothetical protein [Loxospora ochrophaea]
MVSFKNLALVALASFAAAQTESSDGQIEVPTSTALAISQISDGQIQATTAVLVSQISDGQPQVPTTLVVPPPIPPIVSAPSGSAAPIPTTNGTFTVSTATPTSTAAAFTGAANIIGWSNEIAGAAMGLAAVGAML